MLRRTLLLLPALLPLLLPGPCAAHEARPLYVEVIEQADSSVMVRWRVPPVVSAQNVPQVELPACEAAGPFRQTEGPRGMLGERAYRCANGPHGTALTVAYPQYNPAVSTLVRVTWASGETRSTLVSPEEVLIALPDQETASEVAHDYTLLGVKHILAGYDHLLFVVCLILIAGTARRVFYAVTGFTIAHSVTLALAALGLVRMPAAAVEATIALSIVFLAVEIARGRRDTIAWRYPVSVALTFGLLHGFGFASVLTEIGLPQTEVPVALLFFNLGVEIGQIIFVAMLLCLLIGLRHIGVLARSGAGIATVPPGLGVVVAYCTGSLAAFWFILRVSAF